MTLDDAPSGQAAVLAPVRGERRLARRLAELGLRAGESVVPLRRVAGGGRLLQVAGSRLAVDRGVLRQLVVADVAATRP